ncbi:MAG: carbohydrate ABC transporter permease [Oscillospiraceae bacterium]|nr:carbohydrate ABC transporter permease [Oscillospiraceae bacterium]
MNKKRFDFFKIIKYLILSVFSFLVLYPIYMVTSGSFRKNMQILMDPFGMPTSLMLDNYVKAFKEGMFSSLYKNSIIVTVFSVALITLFSSMIAYVMTRPDFKFRRLLNTIFIIGMTIPFQVGIIPLYLQMNRLRLVDSHLGLIIVYIVSYLSYSTFITYGFFKQIPRDLQEAASIDGAGNFRLFLSIVAPLSSAVLTTVTIFNLMFVWNDMFFSLVMLQTPLKKTLQIGLLGFRGQYQSDYATMFAGVVLVSLPMVALFLALQKRFVEGVLSGAIKG